MQATHRETDRETDDARLCERRIEDALLAEALLQAFGDAENAAVHADVFTEKNDVGVLLHLLNEREIDRLDKIEVRHGGRPTVDTGLRSDLNSGSRSVVR